MRPPLVLAAWMSISLVLAVPSQLAAQEPAADPRPLRIDDLFAIRGVGSPALSPDAAWLAYTVTTTSLEDDTIETRIWMVPTAGGEAIPMTRAGSTASSPAWSPDGRFLSFLAARGEGKTQLWVLDRRGGEARQLTDVKQGVGAYEWSPDGAKLALVITDAEPEDDSWTSESPKPWVIDRLQFKRDYTGYLTGDLHDHIYVFDLAGELLTQVTAGDYDDSSPTWSPDSRLLAFASNRTEEPDSNRNTDIWVVAADNDDHGSGALQLTSNSGSDEQPAWSPDGNSVAFVSVVEPELMWYATSHLAVVPIEGGEPRLLAASLDRNVSRPRYLPDGNEILVSLEDSGEQHLASIGVLDGQVRRPLGGAISVRGFDLATDGTIAAVISSPHKPGEVFLKAGAQEPRQLTHVNDAVLAGLRLGAVENIHVSSADGTEIEGFVVKPPDFVEGTRYRTLLRIHGGPASQYDFGFNFEAQLFAAHGYLVVMANPRGSTGYGQAFSSRLWADWGNIDFEDVMAAVDHVIDRGWADPERLGVGGWSYGGILTDHVITKTDRFAAAISGASEVLYVANYGHDHYQYEWETELGLPWVPENRARWEAISPFNRVDRITTPTLVMGGEKDWNVPIQNSEQLYQALRRLGVPTELVVYPGQFHGIRVPAYQRDRYQRYLDWYDRWLGNGASEQ